jgi:hypothetical protein
MNMEYKEMTLTLSLSLVPLGFILATAIIAAAHF